MRLAQGQHGVAVLVGDGVAQQLVGGSCIELEVAHDGGRIGACLLERFAAVARFELRQLFGVVLQGVGEFHQHPATLGSGESAPGAFKGVASGRHGLVDVVCVAACDGGKGLARGRVDDRDGFTRVTCDPLVVDEVL